jgi:signal transduction histidine kinase
VLNCSVVRDSVEDVLDDAEPERSLMHEPSAVEIPYFSEFAETACSLAQLDLPVRSLDGVELRVELRLSVKTDSDRVWQAILKEIGSATEEYASGRGGIELENNRIIAPHSMILRENRTADSVTELGVEEFAAELTHALKNPLGAIIAATDLVSSSVQETLSKENRELLDIIKSQAQRADTILQNYLELVHEPDLHLSKMDIVEFTRGLAERCATDGTGTAKPALSHEVSRLNVMLDPDVMKRALMFLIEKIPSALDSPCGVAIGCSRTASTAQIEIEYHGDGIRPDILRKVVLPFDTTRDGGSGLGLHKVFGTINAHNGRLAIGSTESGAVIRLILPVCS